MIGLRAKSPANQDIERDVAPEGFDDPDLRLGDVMRGERATLGKSLLDVQRELRIRASYVAAIENCDISAFDAPSFISGYVRSYAKYLGMNPEWAFRRFCAESGFVPVHGMAPAASGPKPQRRPADMAEALANPRALFIPQPQSFWSGVEPRAIGSVVVLALLVGALGYGGWSVLQEVQKVRLAPGDEAPGVIAALDPTQDPATPALIETADAGVNLPQPEGLDRAYRPETLDVPVLIARDGPISAIDPGLPDQATRQAAVDPRDLVPVPVAGEAALTTLARAMQNGPQLPVEQAAVRTVAPDAPEVEVLAVRPAWVRVRAADGTILLEKTMDAGERFALPKLEEPPILRSGNSGAVYFAVNGRTYGPAAPGPQVVNNVELSPTALTAKYAFADLAKDEDLARMVAVASAEQHVPPADGVAP
ncbi:MAG: DUF4115 domain-containing protein [Paracoccus sp. (in: a-proteobacteria)]|uniref:helix-turn-helix domain-containing protein n=1 Tax=Paracoccus sp. TaxID=267 RepID=UPI0026E0E59E|nr:helix-turn-helix domain-containing protein [Paracoccus sp. (in: a-proteobacteria)]MDO5621046.1 DUF4115 domain-containing protein [Paracoccus sp. (in: a-proteobacteria)]